MTQKSKNLLSNIMKDVEHGYAASNNQKPESKTNLVAKCSKKNGKIKVIIYDGSLVDFT